jgi:hypothetical protein
MKRALIAIASVGILIPAVWAVEANAQYGAPPPAYSQPPASTLFPSNIPSLGASRDPLYRSGPLYWWGRLHPWVGSAAL